MSKKKVQRKIEPNQKKNSKGKRIRWFISVCVAVYVFNIFWIQIDKVSPRDLADLEKDLFSQNSGTDQSTFDPVAVRELLVRLPKKPGTFSQKEIESLLKDTEKLLITHYKANNKKFVEELQLALKNEATHGKLVAASGIAGLGKSFIAEKYFKHTGSLSYCTIKLHSEFRRDALRFAFKTSSKPGDPKSALLTHKNGQPDFSENGHTFGKLPQLLDEPKALSGYVNLDFSFFQGQEIIKDKHEPDCRNKEIIIIDDLDEIHPKSIPVLLEAAVDFSKRPDTPVLIILGRPEAFRQRAVFGSHSNPKMVPVPLVGPNLHKHELGIELLVLNGLLYHASGTDSDMRNKISQAMVTEISSMMKQDNFTQVLSQAGGSITFSSAIVQIIYKNKYGTEQQKNTLNLTKNIDTNTNQFKERIFSMYRNRAAITHSRPEEPAGREGDNYMRILQAIAVKYSESTVQLKADKKSNNGWFFVAKSDSVSVKLRRKDGSYEAENINVQRLLNNSGLIDVKPNVEPDTYYRFEPFWVQRYLIQAHNNQLWKDREPLTMLIEFVQSKVK